MKSYFLPLGSGAEQGLSAMLTALSCGAAPQPSSVFMLRVPVSASGSWAGGLWADVQSCHRLLAGKDEFAFFRTEWETSVWVPALPERDALVGTEESRLLLQALRGDGVPFSFRTYLSCLLAYILNMLVVSPSDCYHQVVLLRSRRGPASSRRPT